MKLSIVIPVLDSHEIVRRQSLHFEKMDLADVEIIFVDDGSIPPLESDIAKVICTGDTRNWTQPKARNIGAAHAHGEFLLFTDIDHIVPEAAVRKAKDFSWDYGRFRREFGVLDEFGNLTQDRDVLEQYGIPRTQRLRRSCHILSMIVRKTLFEKIGGFRERLGTYPTHDDGHMKRMLKRQEKAGMIKKCPDNERSMIYVFPNGRFCGDKDANPFGLFHGLSRCARA